MASLHMAMMINHVDQINIYLYLQLSRWLRRRQKRCLRWDLSVELMKTNIYKKCLSKAENDDRLSWIVKNQPNQTI